MEKAKLIFDIEEFKNLFNEKIKFDYEYAKEEYKVSRKLYIIAFVFFCFVQLL